MELNATSLRDLYGLSSFALPLDNRPMSALPNTMYSGIAPQSGNCLLPSLQQNSGSFGSTLDKLISSLQTLVDSLNKISAQILSLFDKLGAWEEKNGEKLNQLGQAENALPLLGSESTQESGIIDEGQSSSGTQSLEPQDINQLSSVAANTELGKSLLQTLSALINSLTGILSAAKAFHQDTQWGDTSYRGTMKDIFSSVLRLSAGSAVGALATLAVGAMSGGTLLPVILGTSAGLGTSSLLGMLMGQSIPSEATI